MLINFIGSRGTHPSSGQGTMSFIVDNKIIFDICPEFVISHNKLIESWNNSTSENIKALKNLYGVPSFSKIEHVFITHLHYDHFGGLRHFLIWSQMFENSFREERPLHIYIPKKNIELFQLRYRDLFGLTDVLQFDESDFFLRYLLIEIDVSLIKYVRIHAVSDGEKIKLGKYDVEARENKHFRGSLSYKLISSKYKLREDQLAFYKLEKGPILSKLQKEKKIIVENKTIHVEDVFTIKKTILGYSGDTVVDLDLLKWFQDSTHLIHETTYFTEGELYHTDSHSSIEKLIPSLLTFSNLKCFLPVHFSGRYTWEEIQSELEKLKKEFKNNKIYAPRIGSVVHYDEQEEKTSIEELELIEKF